jgi:acyl-CoA thioester hydrolase
MMLSAEIALKAQFYDLDPMQVVWHGNYPRYLEQARCALLDRIGYNYTQMQASGYAWPIVEMRIKYVRPIVFGQEFTAEAKIVGFENGLKIDYRLRALVTREVLTKAHTYQLPVKIETGELCIESPAVLTDKLRDLA